MSGRLTLSWANKDRALVSTPDGGYEWVSPDDPRAREIRLLDPVSTYGDDDSPNLLIRGDALHALRSLARIPEYADEYRGKVKLVYIDPPFNTGQAFEHYGDALEHSVWLGMMRERLEAIRDLLSPDGSVWVHLDDAEVHYAKVLIDEIFGRQNFVATVVWEKGDSPRMDALQFSERHDLILLYSASSGWRPRRFDPTRVLEFPLVDEIGRPFRAPGPLRKWGANSERADRPNLWYPLVAPDGTEVWPVKPDGREGYWRWKRELAEERAADLHWEDKGSGLQPYVKEYEDDERKPIPPETLWPNAAVGHNREAKAHINAMFGRDSPFSTPKPERLLERIIHIGSNPGDIVLDAFAGSGTTAAVAQKMGRRWATVEQQESTVDAFTRPRLVKVIDGEDPGGITASIGWTGGGGFRELRVAPAAFEVVVAEEFRAISLPEGTDDAGLARSVAAQLGYELEGDGPSTPFGRSGTGLVGRRGRSRLAVVRGVADTEVIEGLVSELDDGETLLLAATMLAPGAAEVLRGRSRGSRVLRIPAGLFPQHGAIT